MITPLPDIAAADYAAGYIGRIPVRNIWLLMLYASPLYRELPPARPVAVEDAPDDIPNLAAEILTCAVSRRLRRNLSHDYQRRQADLNRVRGRINLLRTERRQLLQRGRIACIFDELTVDTPRNRYVKAALRKLTGLVKGPELSRRCRTWAGNLERAGVTDPLHHLGRPEMPTLWDVRTDAADRQMLAAAQLAFDLSIPTEDAGSSDLALPDKEKRWAQRLFEYAVAGFYAVTLPQGWRVRHGKPLSWQTDAATPGIQNILPGMIADIVLEHSATGRRIVIDTKFTDVLTPGRNTNPLLKSGHIYQIYAYLRSQERRSDPLSIHSTGVLLYPSIDYDVDEAAVIQGHEIRFATVDLAADSAAIRQRLLDIALTSPLAGELPA